MAAVSSSNDAFRGGPCSRSPERIVKTYSGNCGSFRPRILPPQGRYRLKLRSEGFRRRRPMLRGLIFEALFPRSLVPPKPCAPEALFCSDFCLRPMIPRPRKSDRVRRLWRNCSGTMRQALDRSVPTRLTSTAPDAEKIRGATGIGKPRRRGALTNSVFQCPATAVSIFRNAIFDCILTACAACGRPS
jgi:hypothetical protein